MKSPEPRLFGVVNITEDSFSDGGLYLEPERAIERCMKLVADGAYAIDLGPASTHPRAKPVSADEELRRLAPVVARMMELGVTVSVDTFQPLTQRWAAAMGVAYLNDTHGFEDASAYPELARANCGLIVMHSIGRRWKADRVVTDPKTIMERIERFFEQRIAALSAAGVARQRIILDPGMGYFLGSNPEPSLEVLRNIARLREKFELAVMVSVSRKSFLQTVAGCQVHEAGAPTLAAEIYAARQGVDFIRTHDVRALRDALKVLAALG